MFYTNMLRLLTSPATVSTEGAREEFSERLLELAFWGLKRGGPVISVVLVCNIAHNGRWCYGQSPSAHSVLGGMEGTRMTASLKETVYEFIRQRLFNGPLLPGSRVSELAISKELGISRTPVREAVGQALGSYDWQQRQTAAGAPLKLSWPKSLEQMARRGKVESAAPTGKKLASAGVQ